MTDHQRKGFLLEDFRLFHLKSSGGTRTEIHYHEFCKILLLLTGSGGYSVEGQRYALQPGDIVLIDSQAIHRPEFEPGTLYERVILYIDPEFLRRSSTSQCDLMQVFRSGHVLRLAEGERKKLFALASQLERELSKEDYGREILCSSLLLRLLVHLGRNLQQEDAAAPSPATAANERVMAILGYLDSHLTEDITIDDLAERFFLSRYHMMHLFRRETGTTIHGYLTERRLGLARELLASGHSATEACFRSGFRSYCSFTRAYGRRFGTTPTGRREPAEKWEETYE